MGPEGGSFDRDPDRAREIRIGPKGGIDIQWFVGLVAVSYRALILTFIGWPEPGYRGRSRVTRTGEDGRGGSIRDEWCRERSMLAKE